MRKRAVFTLIPALILALLLTSCMSRLEAERNAGYGEGYSQGYKVGSDEGYDEGFAAGLESAPVPEDRYDVGYDEGFAAGSDEGYENGYAQGHDDAVAEMTPPEVPADARSSGPDDPSGFVDLAEAVPDAILEIRYYSTYNFVGARVDGYQEPVALMTREAAAALKSVSDGLLEKGYRLLIYDAYRPQSAVDHFLRWAEDGEDTAMKAYFYPNVEKSALFDQGYIAKSSGHTRGSTVDLTLFDMASGKAVDMGGVFDYLDPVSARDRTEGLTEEQIANRKLLREAMEAGGFKSLSTEWWHFTLEKEPYPDTYFTFPVASLGR